MSIHAHSLFCNYMAISLVSYRTKTSKYTEQRNYKSEIDT